ncbi:DNA adenine methylase [Blautia sp.]|uniref:DNA adenine methylase n=1 Tax=Blautia sp. TaxID=1955243 RepID=UPI002E7A356D|nr:DNA adenine methylase [Blautia sp.]MEE0811362.1 DNA adenine methylase [Blautia sp.]
MENEYIKSPLNYVGGKYKLLNQIIPIFPEEINTFVDLFGGGFNVGCNVKAEHVVYNDILKEVVSLLKYIQGNNTEDLLSEIEDYIKTYSLSKENKEGYLTLRSDYNSGIRTPMKFYTLLCYAFNNQIRFNSKGEYNMPFGKNRSSFNPSLRKKFIAFADRIQELNCTFLNISFDEFNFSTLTEEDFIYVDPPYYNSVASYNENGGWTEENEKILLEILDLINDNHIKFALSNNLKYENPLLDEWKNKYTVHYLNGNYSNCNYQKKDKSKDMEVLITNY